MLSKKQKQQYHRNYGRARRNKITTINHRVSIYGLKDIIEVHRINDVLGDPPYCRKRFFMERNSPLKPMMDDILDHYLITTMADLFSAKTNLKLQRLSGMMFHAKMPYFGMIPDMIITSAGPSAGTEVIWNPVIIEVVSEPLFRVFQHNGITDRQMNILQACLSIKKRARAAYYIIGCTNPLAMEFVAVEHDHAAIQRIEFAVEDMFGHIETGAMPKATITNCDSCDFFRHCIQPKTVGEFRKGMDALTQQWLRAERNVFDALRGREAIENAIKHELKEVEEVHTASANVTYKTINKWKIDSERLMAEHPDIGRAFKKTISERKLRISR